jgi:hypothetical protein
MKTLQEQVEQVHRIIDDIAHVRSGMNRTTIFAVLVQQLNRRLYRGVVDALRRHFVKNPGGVFTSDDYHWAVREAAQELEGKGAGVC